MIVVRTAAAADRRHIEAMHAQCSLASRIGRWHAPLRSIPERYLDDALAGRGGHVCAVALGGTQVIGFASAVRGFGDRWDVGVLVRDDRQRSGVGTRLIDRVIRDARHRGAASIGADLRPDRRFLLDVLRRHGSLTTDIDGDGIHARIDLATPAIDLVRTALG